jgi:anti-anti-sigma regulatory factor
MGSVEVVDRSSQEIVVFLSGDVDDSMGRQLDLAIEEVAELEPPRVVVDLHDCTSLRPVGVQFLDALRGRGRLDGWQVDLTAISPAARNVLEEAGWIHPVLHTM